MKYKENGNSWSARSIKTRIETLINAWSIKKMEIVEVQDPLKQGLKLEKPLNEYSVILIGWSARSIKTRIETPF